jgi:hypothetical protein
MSSFALATPFKEFVTSEGGAEDTPSMASYLIATDSHSIANANKTFLESAAETAENIPKFIGTSLISGANQIYNIAPTIGNFFGGDFELSDTAELMQNIDDDLGAYYKEHQQAVDAVGFFASSLIPGMAGIKVLNAGQKMLRTSIEAGKFGTNTGKALGLLAPSRQKHLNAAVKEIVNKNSTFKLADENVLKALRAGFGQSILEATAFEVAVAATLNESPVLQGQDFSDFAWNIAIGGVAFGAIGGVIDAAKASSTIKKAVKAADAEAMPWTHVESLPPAAGSADKIIHDMDQIRSIPEIPAHIKDDRLAFIQAQARKKEERLLLRVRKNMGDLAKGDQEVADNLFASIKNAKTDDVMHSFLGAKEIGRMTSTTGIEVELSKLGKRAVKGTASLDEAERISNLNLTFVKMWGESAGNTTTAKPVITSLSDTLAKGQKIEIRPQAVVAGKTKYNMKERFDLKKVTPLQAQARHIWAQKASKISDNQVLDANDIPMLEKYYNEFDKVEGIKLKVGDDTFTMADKDEVYDFLIRQKERVANELNALRNAKKVELTQEEIASIVNVRNTYLSGEIRTSDRLANEADIFALQSYSDDYTKQLVRSGARSEAAGTVDVWNVPQHTKVVYDNTPVKDVDGTILEGMATIRQQGVEYETNIARATASVLGDDSLKLVEITDKDVLNANRLGAGPGFFAAASSNYGTIGSKMEFLGNTVTGIIERNRTSAREAIEPALVKLAQNQDAYLEWSVLNNRLRQIPDQYVINDEGTALIPAVVKEYNEKLAAGLDVKPPKLRAEDSPLEIPIKNVEVSDLARIHIELNGKRVDNMRTVRTAQGMEYATRSDVFYPTPVNPNDFPFFAIVSDESITGTGHTKMLFANSEDQLQKQISAVTEGNPTLKVRTKKEAEDYWKAVGQFDFEKTLNENYLDIAASRKGVSAPYIVPTDPQKVTNELLSWHLQKEAGIVRETVAARYEKQFTELRKLGEAFTNVQTSKFGSLSTLKHAEEVVENPFMDYVKTGLGIRNYADYPFWASANKLVDSKVSQMYERTVGSLKAAKTPQDLDKINGILKEHGYKGAAYDANMELLANHKAPKGVLTNFIHRGNAILATTMLRLDTLNAVNNTVGAQVLLGAETKAVIRAIQRGDEGALGELAKVSRIAVPGTEQTMVSAPKLIANAIAKFGSRDKELMQFYRDNRFITTISDQYTSILDDLTLKGTETVSQLDTKIKSAMAKTKAFGDLGEKMTGNRLAEEFNRFIAADVMKQLSDIGVKRGLISPKEQLAYINTFVNRTQGNYLAAQRPMAFQGPIGQAIGLFQTYQFNLMQQLLRHVGEGSAKDSMTLLGLQGTIYGMNGMPAFNAINTHLIGTASGNTQHKDFYDVAYGAAGKTAGDWLMYGVASNMLLDPELKTNLYVRGDINPRHVTILPTNPADVPIVGAYAKFFGNIFRTTDTLMEGGDVTTTLLQGLEHNGISRPLAGIAQTLKGLTNPEMQAYSTSKRGNVIASNDMLSWANMTRMLGGKPMAEAIAIDSAFRFKTYAADDTKKRQELGKAIKTTMIAGQEPSLEQIEGFAERYVEIGGKQEEFNKWATQLYKTANSSQANELQKNLDSPFAKSMQQIMGGYQLKDFMNR